MLLVLFSRLHQRNPIYTNPARSSFLLLIGIQFPLLEYKDIARDALVHILDVMYNSFEVRSGIVRAGNEDVVITAARGRGV